MKLPLLLYSSGKTKKSSNYTIFPDHWKDLSCSRECTHRRLKRTRIWCSFRDKGKHRPTSKRPETSGLPLPGSFSISRTHFIFRSGITKITQDISVSVEPQSHLMWDFNISLITSLVQVAWPVSTAETKARTKARCKPSICTSSKTKADQVLSLLPDVLQILVCFTS